MPSSERKLRPIGKPGPVVVTATVDESAYDALIREGLQQKGYLTA